MSRRAALLWLWPLVGCTIEPTQLVVAVQTDMEVPGELEAFSVSVEGPSGRPLRVTGGGRDDYDVPLTLTAPSDLPATFGVRPRDGDASRRVTVRATAFADGAPLFETRTITSFVEGEQLRLDLFLAERCLTEECLPDETCTRGGCAPPEVPADSLPQWSGSVPELPPVDAGVPVEPGWPRLLGWAGADGGEVLVTDAVARDGIVFLFGTALGHVWLEGAPEGTTEVDAATERAWVICMGADGAFCGLDVLGSDGGAILAPRGVRDTQGRIVIAANFRGSPRVDEFELDAGPADRAVFVTRLDPSDGTQELGLLETPAGLEVAAISSLASDAVILSLWVDDPQLQVTRFDGAVDEHALRATGSTALVLDPSLRPLGDTAVPGADASSPAAAVAGGVDARVAVGTPGNFLVLHFREGQANPWRTFLNTTDCSAMAAAAAGDGTIAITCSATGPSVVDGAAHERAGDVWIGVWSDASADLPEYEAALGGGGEEVVLDGAGDAQGTLYFVGHFSGRADLGGESLQADGPADALLFWVHIAGGEVAVDRAFAFASAGRDEATAVAVDPEVGVVVAGRLGAPSEIDGVPIGDEGMTSLTWVHRVSP